MHARFVTGIEYVKAFGLITFVEHRKGEEGRGESSSSFPHWFEIGGRVSAEECWCAVDVTSEWKYRPWPLTL